MDEAFKTPAKTMCEWENKRAIICTGSHYFSVLLIIDSQRWRTKCRLYNKSYIEFPQLLPRWRAWHLHYSFILIQIMFSYIVALMANHMLCHYLNYVVYLHGLDYTNPLALPTTLSMLGR